MFAILSLFRLGYAIAWHDRLKDVPDWTLLFLRGLRIDAIVVCGLSVIPTVLLFLVPGERWALTRTLLRIWALVTWVAVFAMEAITFSYLEEYDARPNRLFVENIVPSREIAETIWDAYRIPLILAIAGIAFLLWFGWGQVCKRIHGRFGWNWPVRLLLLLPMLLLLAWGARGFDHRPVNASSAFFSTDNLANQLALNSLYSAVDAANRMKDENSPVPLYGDMPEEEIVRRMRAEQYVSPESYLSGPVPLMRKQTALTPSPKPRNYVIVLEESLGAEYIGILGGAPLSPEFDALCKEGLLFTNLYSTGTRTVRGLEAVLSSFLPTPGRSVVKLDKSQRDFFTIAGLLKSHGYATDFVYGGEGHFDNMRSFMFGNGFETVTDQHDYKDPAFLGTWGVSDEDLMGKAIEVFRAHGDQPFFGLILTTTNHSPFEFPDGRIELYEQPVATRFNTSKYADYAIGELFRKAKQEPWYDNTVWLVVADHSTRVYGEDLIPVRKFHIPGLLIGPGIEAGSTYDKVASQADLTPTAVSLLGFDTVHPMMGRNVLELPADAPGRAILQQFDTHALMVDDQVWVHQPRLPVRQFTYVDKRLEPAA
ncbi:MAG: LTA synthase family protein [Planctomycetota bacterium]